MSLSISVNGINVTVALIIIINTTLLKKLFKILKRYRAWTLLWRINVNKNQDSYLNFVAYVVSNFIEVREVTCFLLHQFRKEAKHQNQKVTKHISSCSLPVNLSECAVGHIHPQTFGV